MVSRAVSRRDNVSKEISRKDDVSREVSMKDNHVSRRVSVKMIISLERFLGETVMSLGQFLEKKIPRSPLGETIMSRLVLLEIITSLDRF